MIAMIPGRAGSTRLKAKNLALLDSRPLMAYAIDAARAAGVFDRVVVNADHDVFAEVAARYGAEFYLRPAPLGSSETRSDSVVYDFLQHHPCDVLAWVNPTSPLQTGDEIRRVVRDFLDRGLDSLITVQDHQVHCVLQDRPVNFVSDEPFARTQDLQPVRTFVYSVMMWRTAVFVPAYEERGHAVLAGRVGYATVSRASAFVVKTKEDLLMASLMLHARRHIEPEDIQYDRLAERLR